MRPHTETACRRGGALALCPQDLDREQYLIMLREKGETFRWQPVSPTLMAALAQHAEERHAPPNERLLRYASGRRILTDRLTTVPPQPRSRNRPTATPEKDKQPREARQRPAA